MDIEKAKDILEELSTYDYVKLEDGDTAIETVLNELDKKENMYKKEYNEHMEKKRQNGVLINNEQILKKELEKKDKEIARLGKTANEYKKAIQCEKCNCSVCEAHINTLELRAELEKKDKEIKSYENAIHDEILENKGKEIAKDEEISKLNKVIDEMAEEISDITGSCPYDKYYYGLDCSLRCEEGIEAECWKEYFTNKAENVGE